MNRGKVIVEYAFLYTRSFFRSKRPVVIDTWVQFPRNGSDQSFCGLGDLLRGVCFLHQICKRFGYEFHVDFRGHQLSRFLEPRHHPYESIVDARAGMIEFKVFTENLSAARYIEDAYSTDPVVTFMTNGSKRTFRDPGYLSEASKIFARDCFRIRQDQMAWILSRLPKGNYKILHVRLGDSLLVDDSQRTPSEAFDLLYEHLKPYITPATLFITDAAAFKQYITLRDPDLSFIQGMPVHIGLEATDEALMDTMTEFVALQRATIIHTYSIYNWDSGFARSASILYDVPMHRIPRIAPWIDGQIPK